LFQHGWRRTFRIARSVMNRVREMRGEDYDSRYATRMKGEGTWAALIRQRFDKASARFGLQRKRPPLRKDLFVAPRPAAPQLDLF
jgi:DNA repair photolyase